MKPIKTADNWDEKIKCIDKNGKWTGKYLTRKEMANKTNIFFNTVFIWFYDLSRDEVLFQRRSLQKKFNPGELGLVGGHVSGDESFEEAIAHEAKEEINVDIKKYGKPIYIGMVKPYGDFRNFVYFYLIVTNKRIKVTKFQKEEIESIHYVNFDKYLSDSKNGKTLMTYESHKKIFNKIKLIINKYNKYAQK